MKNFITNKAFKVAKPIIEQLMNNNFQAYYVGGCIRDLLLKKTIQDIDITTSALPEEIQKTFSNVIPVGIEHGTLIVRFQHESFEVTTFRTTKNTKLSQSPTLEEDLKLRDFTMNALAMDLNGNIFDYYQGVKDIQNKTVRLVADDERRFIDDPLRILRAFRFAAQLDFFIEENTFSKIIQHVPLIKTIKIERLHQEWTKLITAKHFFKTKNMLIESNILSYLPIFKDYPELIKHFKTIEGTFHSFAHFIAQMHFINPVISIDEWCKQWNTAKQEKHTANKLVHLLTYTKEHNLDAFVVYQLPEELTFAFSALVKNTLNRHNISRLKINSIRQSLPIQCRNELQVNGNDLIRLFPNLTKGSWIKEMLEKIEKQIVLSTLQNEYNAIKEWILCNPPNQK